METVTLKARLRTGSGKSYTRKARSSGWIPSVCYGHNQESRSIEVQSRDLAKLLRGKKSAQLIDLDLGDAGRLMAIIKEVQRDVVRNEAFYHVDFQHIAMDEKITVQVPVEIIGIPIGVREDGGILEHPVRQITVECLPTDIPEKLTVDVTEMKIGDTIHIRDVSIDKGHILNSPDEVVAVVSVLKEVVETPVAEAAAAPVEGADAATDTEGNKDGPAEAPAAKEKERERDKK